MNHVILTPATAVHKVLRDAMAARHEVVVLTESLVSGDGSGAWVDQLAASFPAGVRALPISDRATAGVAVGLALGGRRPVVDLSSTGRLAAQAEVLQGAMAIAAAGEFSVPVVWCVSYGGEAGSRVDAPALDQLAALGISVWAPREASTVVEVMQQVLRARGPAVVLLSRALRHEAANVPETVGEPCPCDCVLEGDDVTVVTWGDGVSVAMDVASTLEIEGLSVRVVDLVQVWPLDAVALSGHVRATGRVVVAAPGGDETFARRVAQVAVDGAFEHLEAPPTVCAASRVALSRAARAAINF
jgi:pyruvate/2-oxoglutarate/acetoin dehydrogenase E1 component